MYLSCNSQPHTEDEDMEGKGKMSMHYSIPPSPFFLISKPKVKHVLKCMCMKTEMKIIEF
jgi:hypothetical protein